MSIEFVVPISTRFVPYDQLKSFWQEAENLGYDHVWYQDHLFGRFSVSDGTQRIYECWTLLASVATTTSTIRIGTEMICNNFRSPGLLAKMASTLDQISQGRLELGMGVGWDRAEHHAYGIPFPGYNERCERLDEAVRVIKKLWTEKKASFQGRFYKIDDAYCEPKPVQKPHPPIMIGGSGDRLLRTVAQQADGCHLFSNLDNSRKLNALRKYCVEARRDFSQLKKTLGTRVAFLSETEADSKSQLEEIAKKTGRSLSTVKNDLAGVVYGPAEQCIDKINAWVEAGFDRFSIDFPDIPLTGTLKRFAEEVMPAFRS